MANKRKKTGQSEKPGLDQAPTKRQDEIIQSAYPKPIAQSWARALGAPAAQLTFTRFRGLLR